MPNALLPVPHYSQSRDGTCLPACIRMVLAYYGRVLPEAEISELLNTRDFGTPLSNALRLSQWRLKVELSSITPERLMIELLAGRPVITRVWTTMLDYWESDTSHVVVVVGFDERGVYVNDPAIETWPMVVLWDGFLAAWFEFNQTAIIIS